MAQDGKPRKLTRVRPPQLQRSYDLSVGETIERDELPFALPRLHIDGLNVDDFAPPSALTPESQIGHFVEPGPDTFHRGGEALIRRKDGDCKDRHSNDSIADDTASNQ